MQRGRAMVLVVAAVLGLAGCGSPAGSGDAPSGSGDAPSDAPSGAPGDEPGGSGGDVVTLAKLTDWQGGYQGDEPFSMLEVAYDEATAERLWAEQVPSGLPVAPSGTEPADAGVYGDLADVDLATHVVAVWSSGESGSCPAWLLGLSTTDDGLLPDLHPRSGVCTADYNPYRLVVAVPREDLPARDELPVPIVHPGIVTDPGRVTAYGE